MRELTVAAPAKANLLLRVFPPVATGYHPVRSIVTHLQLADELVLRTVPGSGLTVRVEGAPDVPDGPANLVHTALDAVRGGAGLDVLVRKRIPAGAGLGGGSADAAAALRGARELLDLELDDLALATVAATLGADVPACLAGGTLLTEGHGERITRLPALELDIRVEVPQARLATTDVYRMFDELGCPQDSGVDREDLPAPLSGLLADLDEPAAVNDLWAAAVALLPELSSRRAALEADGPVLMSGSGSALLVLPPRR